MKIERATINKYSTYLIYEQIKNEYEKGNNDSLIIGNVRDIEFPKELLNEQLQNEELMTNLIAEGYSTIVKFTNNSDIITLFIIWEKALTEEDKNKLYEIKRIALILNKDNNKLNISFIIPTIEKSTPKLSIFEKKVKEFFEKEKTYSFEIGQVNQVDDITINNDGLDKKGYYLEGRVILNIDRYEDGIRTQIEVGFKAYSNRYNINEIEVAIINDDGKALL